MKTRHLLRRVLIASGCLALLLSACPALAQEAQLKKGDRLVIVGDSITEQKLYSRYMEDYLTVCTPQLDLWILQLGWGGETAPGFLGRMDQDLLSFKPTVITTCYGMNDGGYQAYRPDIGKNYEGAMGKLIQRAKAAGVKVLVGSPGAVDTQTWHGRVTPDVYNDNLAHLRDIAKKLAGENSMPFANVHDALIETMAAAKAKLGKEFQVCGGDGVHPGPDGHIVMAYAFLKAMGLDGDIGTITFDAASGSAKASDGHKVLSAKDGQIEIESSRYPFCFFGDATRSDSTKALLPFCPFNKDLNRLTLVVENLKADKAKVTWGGKSKSFTKEQLAKGINLADEFLNNPFCAAFQKVDNLVGAKQNFETDLIKNIYRSLGSLKRMKDPEIVSAADMIQTRLVARQALLRDEIRAAVTPVKHTLVITAE